MGGQRELVEMTERVRESWRTELRGQSCEERGDS
jgi:hypothetical protein